MIVHAVVVEAGLWLVPRQQTRCSRPFLRLRVAVRRDERFESLHANKNIRRVMNNNVWPICVRQNVDSVEKF